MFEAQWYLIDSTSRAIDFSIIYVLSRYRDRDYQRWPKFNVSSPLDLINYKCSYRLHFWTWLTKELSRSPPKNYLYYCYRLSMHAITKTSWSIFYSSGALVRNVLRFLVQSEFMTQKCLTSSREFRRFYIYNGSLVKSASYITHTKEKFCKTWTFFSVYF